MSRQKNDSNSEQSLSSSILDIFSWGVSGIGSLVYSSLSSLPYFNSPRASIEEDGSSRVKTSPLMENIYNGRFSEALEYIKNKQFLDEKDGFGDTPLHASLNINPFSFTIFKALLEAGVNLNAKNELGKTALHLMVEKGLSKELDIILKERKLDVNVQDKKGDTALHYACRKQRSDLAKKLFLKQDGIKTNADIRNNDDKTALELANDRTREAINLVLINSEVDKNITTLKELISENNSAPKAAAVILSRLNNGSQKTF